MSKIRVLECFGGIGACSEALTQLGVDYKIVDYIENDKFAVKVFNAIHGTNFVPTDIRSWDKSLKVDLLMHGSPCQDISNEGKSLGADEGSNTRSSLMYETLRIIEKNHPKYVIWENVKNLLSKQHIHNFMNYQKRMSDLGYDNYYAVLDAKDYGLPQHRERVFTVSILRGENKKFVFPVGDSRGNTFDILEDAPESFDLSKKRLVDLTFDGVIDRLPLKIRVATKKGYDEADIGDSICVKFPRSKTRRGRVGHGIFHTITRDGSDAIITPDFRVRLLTPRENWRLMGFSDESFDLAKDITSKTQLRHQAGNSICVPVLKAILKELLKDKNDRRRI